MSEQRECDLLYALHKQGARARHTGESNPHPSNTIASFMHSGGWLTEDLRRALCRSNRDYAWGQAQFDKTPGGIGPS